MAVNTPFKAQAGLAGGIDLGGTKIEARLFDAQLGCLQTRRIPTPARDFNAFILALKAQIDWLEAQAAGPLPIGIGLPGIINGQTGEAMGANIPVTGMELPATLRAATGRDLPLINDGQAFALSEAHGGAGAEARAVLGLIMGTGIGAGYVLDGALPYRRNIAGVEIGHLGIPARSLARHGLPARACGCGKSGCFETYLSGPGLMALAQLKTGRAIAPPELGQSSAPEARHVLEIWAELMAELLLTVQLALDPDCIVLGGGLSQLPDLPARLRAPFAALRLGPMALPDLRLAAHGDSSGARGAAIFARQQLAGRAQ